MKLALIISLAVFSAASSATSRQLHRTKIKIKDSVSAAVAVGSYGYSRQLHRTKIKIKDSPGAAVAVGSTYGSTKVKVKRSPYTKVWVDRKLLTELRRKLHRNKIDCKDSHGTVIDASGFDGKTKIDLQRCPGTIVVNAPASSYIKTKQSYGASVFEAGGVGCSGGQAHSTIMTCGLVNPLASPDKRDLKCVCNNGKWAPVKSSYM